jgi:hypothetical protein
MSLPFAMASLATVNSITWYQYPISDLKSIMNCITAHYNLYFLTTLHGILGFQISLFLLIIYLNVAENHAVTVINNTQEFQVFLISS